MEYSEIIRNSPQQKELQVEDPIHLRVQVDDKILNEACQFFPQEYGIKYPRAIRELFGGKRKFLVYFSNSSNSSFQDSINLLLATDVDDAENNRILKTSTMRPFPFMALTPTSTLKSLKFLRFLDLLAQQITAS